MLKKLIPALLITALFVILVMLGFWQLDRAEEKQGILQQATQASNLPARVIPTSQITTSEHHNIILRGRYLNDFQLIYDNQIVNSRSGYYVLTPFKIEKEESVILVNRGFIPWGHYRIVQDINVNGSLTTITGKVQLPKMRMELRNTALQTIFPSVIQTIDFNTIDKLLGTQVVRSIVLLSDNQDNGYNREWMLFYGSVDKHLGYALQWFMMAFALFIIAIVLVRKSRKLGV